MKTLTIILLLLTVTSCKTTDPDDVLVEEIQGLYEDITMMVTPKGCTTDPGRCRFIEVSCGFAYAYDVTQVDTVQLIAKYNEIKRLSAQRPVSQHPCDIIAPDSTEIRGCNCSLAYSKNR